MVPHSKTAGVTTAVEPACIREAAASATGLERSTASNTSVRSIVHVDKKRCVWWNIRVVDPVPLYHMILREKIQTMSRPRAIKFQRHNEEPVNDTHCPQRSRLCQLDCCIAAVQHDQQPRTAAGKLD